MRCRPDKKSKENYIRMEGTNSRKMSVEMTLINNNNNNSGGIYVQMQANAAVSYEATIRTTNSNNTSNKVSLLHQHPAHSNKSARKK